MRHTGVNEKQKRRRPGRRLFWKCALLCLAENAIERSAAYAALALGHSAT